MQIFLHVFINNLRTGFRQHINKLPTFPLNPYYKLYSIEILIYLFD
jgi:hypothetical protein